jgi:hypothetical protein
MADSAKTVGVAAIGILLGGAVIASSPWEPEVQDSRWDFERKLDFVCGESRAELEAGITNDDTEFAAIDLSSPVTRCDTSEAVTNVSSSVRVKYHNGNRIVPNDWTTATQSAVARQDVPVGTGISMCGRVKYRTASGPVEKTWYFDANGYYHPKLGCNW